MAKMRVHELAKELEIKSQEIIDLLESTEHAVKSASSNVEDVAQKMVREHFGKGKTQASPGKEQTSKEQPSAQAQTSKEQPSAQAQQPKKEAAPKKEGGEKEAAAKEQAKKAPGTKEASPKEAAPKGGQERRGNGKKESASPKELSSKKEGEKSDSKDRPKKKSSITAVFNAQYSKQSRRQGQGNGRRGDRGNGKGGRPEAAHSIIRPRPVGERALRPISERTANNEDEFMTAGRPANERPAGEKRNGGERANGEKRNGGERANGEKRNGGERANSERPRFGSDRRPQGDRNRSQNDRNDRNDRNNDRSDRNAGRNQGRNRSDKEMNRFGKDVQTGSEDIRGKESRERGNDRKTGNKRQQDHDKLGKRQENYVNLEKNGGRKKPQQPQKPKEDENTIKTITLPEKLTIRELADAMKVQPSAIVKKLFLKGQMVTVNQEVDFESAEEIALEFNFICEPEEKVDVIAELLKEEEENEKDMVPRPPVVCVMGHVDHGKTSLLDAIRSTRVTDREAGGITQHIGASVVSINGQNITFLDTPGHEAFTAMRMRGANSTDIAILVVAADDGVMPQTIEAINHAKAAGVEIIVAVNKIDKPSANIEKVKQELSEYELIPEDWGGSTIFCPVSAHTKEGIDNLLEMILLTAEVLELKANPNRNARGLVIEAQLDKGRGAVATVLVQKGTLHVGDSIACGSSYGKVRAMVDDKGRRGKSAIPSTPVEILGLNNVPAAGETFVVCDSDKEAKAFADTYISEEKNRLLEDTKARMSLDDLFSQIQSGNMKELDIIVKADVQGSVEAVKQSLVKLSNEEVVVKVIHGGVGAINESDVILASASNAIIIGFNVRPDPIAKVTADNEGVDIRLYKVIYNAIEDVEAAMKGMLDPVFEEKVIGHAEIRQIFKASGVGNIAGSYVLDGILERGCKVRIFRGEEKLFEGDLASLKRFKDDVKEVRTGFECGLVFDGFNDIEEFDRVEAYKMVEVPR
ncbi:MAG: translation initiation factor IF-2 [Roseburia sp.]|nr:translation initiation factor IF-2 [Roseburia sp.]